MMMNKFLIGFLLMTVHFIHAQWKLVENSIQSNALEIKTFQLDYPSLHQQLQEAKANTSIVKIIEIPTQNGTLEKFKVHSFPVVSKELAEKYHLYSFTGTSVENTNKKIRFSLSKNHFQGTIISEKGMEFIESLGDSHQQFVIKKRENNPLEKIGFRCSSTENVSSQNQLNSLLTQAQSITKTPLFALNSSDRKYRTLRIVISVTGEYTQYFGGVDGALAQINATLTRVNSVLEKDLALHLVLQNYPQLIYTDPTTDPYSDAKTGVAGIWGTELQKTITSVVGEANYDIGHLFGKSGGGGNSGCIGCICESPAMENGIPTSKGKGAGFTSPANGIPKGDVFDIDFVTHEIGHQLGAFHTFSYVLENNTNSQVEPGSGSTIMGYAGITGTTDVQKNTDPYFHQISIKQIQDQLMKKNCDTETPIANNPPSILPMVDYSIPKGTAFFLTAQASDVENNPLTYTWEQMDVVTAPITKTTGLNTTGPLFRSLLPTSNTIRFFPKLESVMKGLLTIPQDWESVPLVAREMNFAVTVRDNNPNATQQQTNSAPQKIKVGNDGPFAVTSTQAYSNTVYPISWNVANTNNALYSVSNVKIDYTIDAGATWTTLFANTPNDGSESVQFPASLLGKTLQVRVSAVGNIFYAVSKEILVKNANSCSGQIPSNFTFTNINPSETRIEWDYLIGAKYKIQYRRTGDSVWKEVQSNDNFILLNSLQENTDYELQVSNVCNNVESAYSNIFSWRSLALPYCPAESNSADGEFISMVKVVNSDGQTFSNSSSKSTYTDYSNDSTKLIVVKEGTQNQLSITITWPNRPFSEFLSAWIDFNKNGAFESNEKISFTVTKPATDTSGQSFTAEKTFLVPFQADLKNYNTKMRIVLSDSDLMQPCSPISYGEVEDYTLKIIPNNQFSEANVLMYPNPVSDTINLNIASQKASYKIYDMSGRLVKFGSILNQKIDVAELAKGMYVLVADITDSIKKEWKFIKM